jgi:hypothetical protein
MRLEPSFGADTSHARGTDAISAAIEGWFQCVAFVGVSLAVFGQNLEPDRRRQRFPTKRTCLVAQQPINAGLNATLLPAPDARLGFAVAICNDRLEQYPVSRAHANADAVSPHGRNLTDLRPLGHHLSGGMQWLPSTNSTHVVSALRWSSPSRSMSNATNFSSTLL